MQIVDFFDPKWHTEYTEDPIFFIYDNGNGDMAKLTANEMFKDTSVNIHNPSCGNIKFLPVDHNMDIRKDGSNDLDSTCDYILIVNEKEQIIFGEIKTGRKGWASEGMQQIKHTVEVFRANHDLSQWKQCRAYVSNWRKWKSRISTRCVEEEFRNNTGGMRLYIQNDVHIDGEQ